MRFRNLLTIALLSSLSLAGCASKSAPVGVEYCVVVEPIYFDSEPDVDLTPASIKRQILKHNNTIVELCRR